MVVLDCLEYDETFLDIIIDKLNSKNLTTISQQKREEKIQMF